MLRDQVQFTLGNEFGIRHRGNVNLKFIDLVLNI